MSVFIIGEAGVNHNGSLKEAFKLIDVAKKSGCDAVKFQTFDGKRLASNSARMADYQKNNIQNKSMKNNNQRQMLESLQLSYSDFEILKRYCDEVGIEFMSTPSDLIDLEFLLTLGIQRIKIGSSDLDNKPLLEKAAQTGLQIIISTGMSDFKQVERSIKYLKMKPSVGEIVVMQCTSHYPCPNSEVNLNVLDTYKDKFNLKLGFSDHTEGIIASSIAVAKGAEYIEKHFTLSKELDGPDHKASLNPFEMEKMINAIREVQILLGSDIKEMTKNEIKNAKSVKKSIVAIKEIKKGEIFSYENIGFKRPQIGISPMEIDKIINQISKKNYKLDQPIEIDYE